MYIILMMPHYLISVLDLFDFFTDHRLDETIGDGFRTRHRHFRSHSLSKPASRTLLCTVTFRLTITRIADLITVKTKRQKNSTSIIKLKRQFFLTDPRIEPKFGTHVRIDTITLIE